MHSFQIIIVEDEIIIAHHLQQALIKMGYAVPAIVTSGEEALKKIEMLHPDLVLMDIRLKGDMDGIEAAAQVHALYDVPVIYLTANADIKTVERAKKTGSYGLIYKPVQTDVMRAVIDMALYKHGMEKQLREREAWLDATLKSIGDAVITTDKTGKITFMNPAAEALTGWKQDEYEDKPLTEIFRIIDVKTRKRAANPVTKALKSGAATGLTNHSILIAKDGSECQIADNVSPIRDVKGDIIGVVLVFRDVIEEYQMQEKITESEKKYSELFNSSLNGIALHEMVLDKNGKPVDYIFLEANTAFETLTGLKVKDIIGERVTEVIPGIEETPFIKTCGEVAITGKPVSFQQYAPQLDKHYDINAFSLRKGCFAVVFSDITEHKQTEEVLRQYKHIVSSSTDMMALLDRRFNYLAANEAYKKAFKLSHEQLIGKSKAEVFGEEFFNTVIKPNADRCLGGEEVIYKDWLEFPAHGRRYMEINYYPYYREDNKIMGFVVNGRDITERKQAEENLKESEEKYRTLFERESDAIFIYDPDTTNIFDANEATSKMYGYDKDELIGMSCLKFSAEVEKSVSAIDKIRVKGDVNVPFPLHQKKDGTVFFVDVSGYTITLDGKNMMFAVSKDITKRTQVEKLNQYRLELEKLENEVSQSFINTDATGIDNAINSALKNIALFSSANRCSLFSISDDLQTLTNSYEWCVNPEDSQIKALRNVPFSTFEWQREELLQHKTIAISKLEDYPSEAKGEKEWIKKHGFQSLLFVPLQRQGRLQATLGIYGAVGEEVVWPPEYINMLKIIGNLILNVLERKQADVTIQNLARFPSENPNPTLRVDQKGVLLYANSAAFSLLHNWNLRPGQIVPEEILKLVHDVFNDPHVKTVDVPCGESIFLITISPFIKFGYSNLYALDITERKQAEQQIQKDLKEKEIMLKEIHHRVKNNLSVIIGLLNLQSTKIKNKKHALAAFKESCDRIHSMVAIHDKLYHSNDFTAVNFSKYIESLAGSLYHTYICDSGRIELKIMAADVSIGLNIAVPCGLIINELITNALKHAFPPQFTQKGKIEIGLRRGQKDVICLSVKDNGVGVPKEFDFRNTETLGMELVSILTEQIGGIIKLERRGGTKFTISFKQQIQNS